MNLRPLGYEPNELPGCSTPRQSSRLPPAEAKMHGAISPSGCQTRGERSGACGASEALLAGVILGVYGSLVNELPCPARPQTAIMLLRTAQRVERALERALERIGLSPAKLA